MLSARLWSSYGQLHFTVETVRIRCVADYLQITIKSYYEQSSEEGHYVRLWIS